MALEITGNKEVWGMESMKEWEKWVDRTKGHVKFVVVTDRFLPQGTQEPGMLLMATRKLSLKMVPNCPRRAPN